MPHPTGVVPVAANHYYGKGALYFDPFNASSVKLGSRFLGNCSKFGITETDQNAEIYDSVSATAGLVVRVATKRTIECSLILHEFDPTSLQFGLNANQGTSVNGSGSIANEVITTASLQGRWYDVSKRKLDTVVVTGPAGTPTYTLTTDYLVDLEVGRIYIVEGGGITNASTVEVDCNYTAETLTQVYAGAASKIEGELLFVGDPINGAITEVNIWHTVLQPDGEMDFIGEDFAQYPVRGAVLNDAANHATSPYWTWSKRPAA